MNWQTRIDRPDAPAVPILVKRMHRIFWAPPRYEALVRYVATHPRLRQRDAAAAVGYSLTGLHRALARLRSWGMVLTTTARGCHGETRVRLQTDVRCANVPATGERIWLRPNLRLVNPESVVDVGGTFERPANWLALRDAKWMAS